MQTICATQVFKQKPILNECMRRVHRLWLGADTEGLGDGSSPVGSWWGSGQSPQKLGLGQSP